MKKYKIKNIKMKLMSIFLLVSMLSMQLEPLTTMMAAAGSLNYNAGKKINPIYDPYYQYSSGIYEDTLGGSYAYCLDYGRELPTGVLSFKNYSSPQVAAVMIYGYPNASAASLGLQNATEANIATKLAMWMVSQATGENTKSIMNFDINRLQATAGYEESTKRAIAAAKVLANKAMTNPYTPKPTIQITSTGAKIAHVGNQIVAGPYKVAVTESSSTKVTNVSLANAPASAITTDAAGNKKTTFNLGEEIFVKMNDTESAGELTFKAQADGEKIMSAIYGNELYYTQHFSVLIKEPISLITNLKLNWNGLEGNIELLKVDQNNDKIKGVTFELRDLTGKVLKTGVTGTDGYLRFSNIAVGEYRLVEISAPDGYIMGKDPINVIVKTGETFKTTYVNKKTNGGLKIIKTDSDKKPLAGVKFQVLNSAKRVIETIITDAKGEASLYDLPNGKYYYKEVSAPDYVIMDTAVYEFSVAGNIVTKNIVNNVVQGSLKIVKTDSDKKPLAGVKFQIMDSTKKVIETITTDASGIANSSKLTKGTYYYKEVEAPSNVIMDTKTYEFKIATANEVITKNVVNEIISQGNLKIVKTDSDKKSLAGVKFQIMDSTKKVIETITTDASGIANSSKLAKGTYYYKEVEAPGNVIMDTKVYEFKISSANEVITKNVINEIVKGSLKIVKVDENQKPLQGVKFQILDSNSKVIETITTDSNGVAVSKELQKGTYYYKEVSAPEGIIIDNNKYEFVVANDNDLVIKNIVNKLVKGKLEILKVDDDKNVIEGVKFDILNDQKQVIQTIVTDSNGIATTQDLTYGKYYYVEVSAPENVVMDTKTYEFNIKEKDQVVKKTVVNSKLTGGLKILKLDKDTKTPIAGVRFEILNSKKEVVSTIITDENGIAKIDKLLKGTYFYKEVKAPDKYIMDGKEYEFVVQKEGQIIEKTVYNEVKKLPVTGGFFGNDTMIILIISIISIFGYTASKFLFRVKPRNRNKILRHENDLIV